MKVKVKPFLTRKISMIITQLLKRLRLDLSLSYIRVNKKVVQSFPVNKGFATIY
jgi:hypothetical protein